MTEQMKWAYFTLGFLPSVAVALTMTLAASEASVIPHAKGGLQAANESMLMIPAGLGGAAGPGGGGGGGISTQNNGLWLLYVRDPSDGERKILGKGFEGQRMSLVSYRCDPAGGFTRQGSVVLMSSREISYDTKTFALPADVKGFEDYKATRKYWEDQIKKLAENESEKTGGGG